MNHPFLVGETIYLRALDRPDAATLLPWVNDQEVIRHLLIHRPANLAAEEAFIEAHSKGDGDVVLGICERATDQLIGATGLQRVDQKNRHALFGIFIGDAAARDKGRGTEATALIVQYAFETLNLNRVWLQVFADNARAVHVYEKLGFRREGVLRQDNFRKGRYGDTVVMGLLRSEWAARSRATRAARKGPRPRRRRAVSGA